MDFIDHSHQGRNILLLSTPVMKALTILFSLYSAPDFRFSIHVFFLWSLSYYVFIYLFIDC